MKVFASFLLLVLAAIVAVQATPQPSPQPTAAPKVEKRQASFDPYNLSQYTNPGALSSLSGYIASQFGALSGMSLDPSYSSFIASQESQAYSYLSIASSIAANGGASNSDLGSLLGSLTATMTGSTNGQGNTSANSGQNNGQSNSGSAAGASATTSKAANAAVGTTAQLPVYLTGMVACTFVAALAGAFVL
ncbi:hypothetical protein PaG_02713 [Moesziomyces aphidis]|uniref:Uncharacterized protein n=1 Tax=Moesziomyces aphidis TaxID=84754 RepID=W3VN01_MOEAP|nr:hypothetical protein PaG_02713 [Moesziomyces aphidis]